MIIRCSAEAAKRTRLERIVRRLTSELLLCAPKISGQGGQIWTSCTEQVLCASGLFDEKACPQTECSCFQAARSMWPMDTASCYGVSVCDPHVEKILVWRRLTPELRRTAARHGVMVHVTI